MGAHQIFELALLDKWDGDYLYAVADPNSPKFTLKHQRYPSKEIVDCNEILSIGQVHLLEASSTK